MSEYIPTIGLEIHAELRTKTKMFCDSKNDADEVRPNVNICPVCLAHPGTLPVINREAVRSVLRVGLALGAKLADYTEFDRKNYFYPDLPKGYQLSQYEYPLVAGGELHGIAITRVHLEEDTASSVHESSSADGEGSTLIDYNRAGVPLMELVTEPVIASAAEAGAFARELQLLLRALGVSDANMEKGEMRVEANVSIRTKAEADRGVFGTKVEIKNLNSFRIMERAVAHEIERQEKILASGAQVIQETRGWDEAKQATFAQRVKEGSADYRYFPDPDLPSLKLSEIADFAEAVLRATMPELPATRRQRYIDLGVKPDDAESYVREPSLGAFFEEVIRGRDEEFAKSASNYIANDLVNIIRDIDKRETDIHREIPISARDFSTIIDMARSKKITSRGAKDLIARVVETRKPADEAAKEMGILSESVSTKSRDEAIKAVIAQNPKVADDYKSGKVAALEFLVGQCMKALRGAADPAEIRALLKAELS